jgi:hypothetical protein
MTYEVRKMSEDATAESMQPRWIVTHFLRIEMYPARRSTALAPFKKAFKCGKT